jgi:hypothetical protein
MPAPDLDDILTKLDDGKKLTAAEGTALATAVRSMGATIAALDEANQDMELHLAISSSVETANAAVRNSVLAGLQMLAPPAATVDIDGAMKAIATLRADVKSGKELAGVIASAANFALKVAGRFV